MKKINSSMGMPSLILKIDLEKAFDKLEWSYIYRTLNLFKYSPNISSLVMSYTTTSTIFILVKENKTEEFTPTGGIRQGDPMSPYLFTLCMDMLSKNIKNQVDTGIGTLLN